RAHLHCEPPRPRRWVAGSLTQLGGERRANSAVLEFLWCHPQTSTQPRANLAVPEFLWYHPQNLDSTAVLSALSPSIFNSDGNLPVTNSAIAAPIDAAMARPARVASRPRVRGAGGGSLTNSGSSERAGGCSLPSGSPLSASGLRAR